MAPFRRLLTFDSAPAALLLLLVIAVALPALFRLPWLAAYLVLVVGTVIVMRLAPASGGSWLGRPTLRRLVVLVIMAVCLAWVAAPSPVLSVAILPLLVVVVIANVGLGKATERVSTAPSSALDERQDALRNSAHVVAYLALAGTLTVLLVVGTLAPSIGTWMLGGGGLLALGELALFLPAMVVAWRAPAAIPPEAPPRRSRLAALAAAMTAATLVFPFVLSLEFAAGPLQTTSMTTTIGGPAGSNCALFQATRTAGLMVQATIPLHAVVCWDGEHAYELWGLNRSDCQLASYTFAEVSTLSCARTTDADGTLRFTYEAGVRSPGFPFWTRPIAVHLAITRSGRVLEFP